MRLSKPIIAIAVASSLALSACGGDGDDDRNSDNKGRVDTGSLGDTGRAQDPTREGPVTIEGAKEGGTVKVISYAGLNTMDPSEAYYQNTWSILANLVARSLTQYVYDEESGGMVLVPDLATDLGTPNEDFTEWRFTIREGVKYENGDPVTPEDIVFGIKRSMDRTQFPEGPAYSNDYFLGGDSYKGPYTSPDAEFEGAYAEGQDVVIKMRTPFPDMPYWGSFPAIGPIPEDASDPAKYALHPLSTGPYMFADYEPEKSLTLVRNPEWDPATDPGRTAYPEKYVFDFQVPQAQVDKILLSDSGEAQTTLTYDDVQAANFRKFEQTGRLALGGFPLTSYWAPDYRKITDIRIRQALAWAYPYADADLAGGYIEDVTSVPGTSLMPPGTAGRTEFNPLEGHEPGTTDAAKAKELLEEAGAVGYEIKWLYAKDDEASVAVKDVVAAALKKAGFTPTPVPTTVSELSTRRANPDEDINVRSAGWIADWPSGGSWFPPVIESTNLEEEGLGANYAVFNEPEVDAEIERILSLPVDEQPDAWGALDEKVMTEYLPLFVIRYGGVAQAHGSKIEGHFIDNTIGMPTWKNIWVNQ